MMIKRLYPEIKVGIFLILIFFTACFPASEAVNGYTNHLQHSEDIMFLSGAERPTEIYIASISLNTSQQITNTEGKVFDYSIQSNPFRIVYSTLNQSNGTDFWLKTDLKSPSKELFSCEEDLCYLAEFSPDGEFMLLTRSGSIKGLNLNSSQPTIWKYRFTDNKFESLVPGSVVFGEHAVISSNNGFIAFQNINPNGIRILDSKGIEVRFITTNQGVNGFTWAKESDVLYYLSEEIVNDLPKTELWLLNMITGENIQIRPDISPDALITKIKSSPDNSKLMIGVVENPLIPNQIILIFDIKSGKILKQLSEPSVSFGNFSWSRNGEKIVFQQFEFIGSDSKPEVGIWDLASNTVSIVAKNAYFPAFIN